MRILAGVVIAVLVLAPLAAIAARGRRAGRVDGEARPLLAVVGEGLVVLAVIVVIVLVIVALLD